MFFGERSHTLYKERDIFRQSGQKTLISICMRIKNDNLPAKVVVYK